MLRRFGVSVVAALLVVTLLTGNVVVASHQTVLDPKFVNTSLAEEDSYETLHREVIEAGEFPLVGSDELPASSLITDIGSRVITPRYLQNQTERNVGRLYPYLHGNRDDPGIAVNLNPAVERTDEAVAATVQNTTLGEVVSEVGIASELPPGSRVNESLLVGLTEGPEEYEETRSEFRARIAERLVSQSYNQLSNDSRLRLVNATYNPDDFTEEEKRQRVADREDEIRAVLREQVVGEDGEGLEEGLNSSGRTLKENLQGIETGLGEDVDTEAAEFAGVLVDGLTAEDLGYAEFSERLEDEKAELGVAIGEFAQSEIRSTLADQESVEDGRIAPDLPADVRDSLEDARQVVGIVDILGIALPIVALLLVGLLWLLSSPATAALWTGIAAIVAGLPGFVGAAVGGPRLESFVTANAPQGGVEGEFVALGLDLVGRVLGTVAAQSLALTVGGGLLALAGAALRLGLVDIGDDGGAGDGEGDDGDESPEHAGDAAESAEPGATAATGPADATAPEEDDPGDDDPEETDDGPSDDSEDSASGGP